MIDEKIVGHFDNLRQLETRVFEEPALKEYISSGRFKKGPVNAPHAKWNGQ